tara:strand:+ start:41581 stop:42936 length:1356 start_codon:yes stop_codon:yes gene_type:complete
VQLISKNNKIFFFSFLLFLIPLSFVFSIFILEIISLIIIFSFLFSSSLNEKKEFLNLKLVKLIFVFWIFIIISALASEFKLFSLKSSLFYIRFLIFALSISWLINSEKKFFNILFYSFLFIFLFLSISGIYEFLFKKYCLEPFKFNYDFNLKEGLICSKKYFIGNSIRSDRLSGLFGDEMIIGSFLSRLLPLVLAMFFFSDQNTKKKISPFLIIVLIFSSIVIILSGERVAFFYFLIIFFSSFVLIDDPRKFFFCFFGFAFFVIIFLYANKDIKYRLIDQTYYQITNKFITDKGDNREIVFFSKQHNAHAVSALKIFSDNVLIGSGPNNFRNLCSRKNYNILYACTTHPHNTYIQLLSETGVLGILIPTSFLIIILKKILILLSYKFRNNTITDREKGEFLLLTCFLISLFPLIPSGNFFNNWMNFVYYTPLGIYINFIILNKSNISHKVS